MKKMKVAIILVLVAVLTMPFLLPVGAPSAAVGYKVIAWNDLGMHCACPGASTFLLLPPYNTLRAQVIQQNTDKPNLVTSGVTVSYAFTTPNETDSYLINTDPYFKDIIANSPKIFPGYQPVVGGKVKGLTGKGLADSMTYDATRGAYMAEGIPAFPVVTGTSTDVMTDPLGGAKRTPFLTATVTVKNTSGTTIATTSTTVPVAFGGCCTCHLTLASQHGYPKTPQGSFQYMGYMHSGGNAAGKINFALLDPDGDGVGGPVRCSWCHWDPAMGESSAPGLAAVWPNYKILYGANFIKTDVKVSQYSFSDVLHRFHSQSTVVKTSWDANIVKNCYDCHPGNNVNCYRDGASHKSLAMWCTDCHGDLNQRVSTNQLKQPWQQSTLPSCYGPSSGITSAFACHSSNTYMTLKSWSGLFGKYLNAAAHRTDNPILCSTCHGSPHALAPSLLAQDNNQLSTLQGNASYVFPSGKNKTYALGVCDVCHVAKSTTWSLPPHNAN